MIDQATIDKIFSAANIVEVVSDFVTLRKQGTGYVGLCPFHDDRSPSMHVSLSKGIFKCFACGAGGNAAHFIMKHENVSYPDALRYLAKKYNIPIEERELTPEEKLDRDERESLLIVNEWARQFFVDQLLNTEEGKIGLRYFIERGFREDIIKKFSLGYSPNNWDALGQAALKAGYKKEFLEKTGLLVTSENNDRSYDRFRGRVMFPVFSLAGKVIAFGGRVLKKDEKSAKYVNSPESKLYHKSDELYGIFFAKQAIVKADRCFLVEGYTDVISMHQAGIENVVASSGTSLTQGQIRLIHRFTNNITVLYDGDAPGIKAALRGIDMVLESGLNVKVLLLPDGEDPDSFARKHNATEFQEYIKQNETDFIHFKTKLLLDGVGDDPLKRSELIQSIIRTIAIVPDNIIRSVYIKDCSVMMGISEDIVLNEVKKVRRTRAAERDKEHERVIIPTPAEEAAEEAAQAASVIPNAIVEAVKEEAMQEKSPFEPIERELLRYIVRYGEQVLFHCVDEETQVDKDFRVAEFIRDDLERDDLTFYTPLYRSMMEEAASRCGKEGFSAQKYFLSHPDANVSLLAADLLSDKYKLSKIFNRGGAIDTEEDHLYKIVKRVVCAFKDAYIRNEIKKEQESLKTAQDARDEEQMKAILIKLTELNKVKSYLSKELGERIFINKI